MANTAKANDLALLIQEELNFRLAAITDPASTYTYSCKAVQFDASTAVATTTAGDGNPYIEVDQVAISGGTVTAIAFIKVLPTPWSLAKDIFGNTANQYVPHTIRVLTKLGASSVLDATQPVALGVMLCVLAFKGCRLEWYQTATAVAPTLAVINNALTAVSPVPSLVYGYDAQMQYPLTMSQ